ncbi:MAG: FKBP-type peptidyl-prolyl cis-trans isomerase [Actinomycetota bacterium]|nr:FKBP-type peptidyl-prolyl cis-trans isomerase [Actinomycetota bacterium]
MAGSKRHRQLARRRQQMAAAAEARRRAARRRNMLVAAGAAAVAAIAVVVLFLVVSSGGGSKKVAVNSPTTLPTSRAPSTSSPTTATLASAAGKPCVKLADPLPSGAPDVPVKLGAPPTQLVTEDLKAGTGPTVTATQTLTVNYIGVACSTGKIFDTSYGKQPATFPLSGVIKGWQTGLPGMKVGGQRLLGIPPDQAYGAQGYPPTIAPAETLWFVVEVVKAA